MTMSIVSPCGASNATSSTSPQTALASAETACDLGKAIFVLGPSSSGKTTLCNALAEELQIHPSRYVKEVARHVMRTQGFTRKDTGTYEMQAAIMRAQLQAEIEVLAVRHPQAVEAGDIVLLSDRSAVDPIVYASTAKTIAESTRSRLLHDSAFQANLALYKRSLFIVLHPVNEWIVDDGVRSLENPWEYLDELFRILKELQIPYVQIDATTKDLRDRVDLVKRWLDPTQCLAL